VQMLQKAIPAVLDVPEATALLLFLFRPFLGPILQYSQQQSQYGANSIASIGLALVHMLHHMLQPSKQEPIRKLQGLLQTDLAYCNCYAVDDKAAEWLRRAARNPAKFPVPAYIKTPGCPMKPLPAPTTADPSSSTSDTAAGPTQPCSPAPGVQALVYLLPSAHNSSSRHVDSVVAVLETLLQQQGASWAAAVAAAACEADSTPLWRQWLSGPVIQSISSDNLACRVPREALEAASGHSSFTLSSSGSVRPSDVEVEVVWSDGSQQVVEGCIVPPRYPVEPLLLGPRGILRTCSPEQQQHHLQCLQQALKQDHDSPGSGSSNGGGSSGLLHGRHLECLQRLVRCAAGLPLEGAAANSSMPPAAPDKADAGTDLGLLAAVLKLVQQLPDTAARTSSEDAPSLKQCTILYVAQLLLHSQLDPAVSGLLHDSISGSWPLPSAQQLQQWISSNRPGSSYVQAGTPVADAFAAALRALPPAQQVAVLTLLQQALTKQPADLLLGSDAAMTAVADAALLVWWRQQQQQQQQGDVGLRRQWDDVQLRQLLLLLDGHSSQVHAHLLELAASAVQQATDDSSAAEAAADVPQELQELHNAAVHLLPLCLASAEGAAAVSLAQRRLLLSTTGQHQTVAAALSSLLWQTTLAEQQSAVDAVVELLLDATGAAATTQLLGALATQRGSQAIKGLIRLLATAAPEQQSHRAKLLWLLVRLLPHTSNDSLAGFALGLCMQHSSLPAGYDNDVSDEEEAPAEPLSPVTPPCSSLWCLPLTAKEVNALVQLLCRVSAPAAQDTDLSSAAGTDSARRSGSFIQTYLAGLLQLLQANGPASQAHAAGSAPGAAANAAAAQFAHVVEQLVTGSTGSLSGQPGPACAALQQQLQHQLPALAKLLVRSIPGVALLANACLMQLLLPGQSTAAAQKLLADAAATRGSSAGAAPSGQLATSVYFFSSQQQAAQQVHAAIKAEDFHHAARLLKAHVKSVELAAAAQGAAGDVYVRLPNLGAAEQSSVPAAATADCSSSSSSMVLTPTTIDNLNHIMDVVQNPAPLLLEGATGVGKSATVAEAARRQGKQLMRFNMSSSLTESDLLGRVHMKAGPDGAVVFEHQLQPFAAAFARGDWLLLDELNLAPDDVLQCIEQALDTHVSGVSAGHRPRPACMMPQRAACRLLLL